MAQLLIEYCSAICTVVCNWILQFAQWCVNQPVKVRMPASLRAIHPASQPTQWGAIPHRVSCQSIIAGCLVGLLTPRITLGIKFVFCRSAIKPKLLAMCTSAVIRVAEYHSCAVSAHTHDYLLLLTLGKSEDRKVSFITQPASKAKPIGHYLHWLKGAARFVTRHQVHQTLVTRHQMHQAPGAPDTRCTRASPARCKCSEIFAHTLLLICK